MTAYANLFDSGGTTKVEIDADAVETSKAFMGDLINAIENMAVAVTDGINKIPEEKRPTDVEISYALKAMSTGGYAVAVGQETANFKVTLRWGGGVEGGLLEELSPSKLAAQTA